MDILKQLGELESQEKATDVGDLQSVYYNKIAPSTKETEYLNVSSGWVYACMNVIADELAKIQLKLYQKKKDGVEEIFEHPVLDLLNKANNFTTKNDLFWLTTNYLEATGEAPWFVLKEGNVPTQIFLIRPDKLSVKAGTGDEFIDGYSYRNDEGKDIPIEADELIFIKYPNPINPFRGQGTLQAASTIYDIEQYSETYNKNFFFNGASAGMVFKTEQKLTKDVRARLRKQIDQSHKGISKAHKFMILEAGLDAKPLQASQKDMEFFNQLNWTRDKILGIFRVPRTALGITDDVNRCYSEDTDVLTENGFKKHYEVNDDEKIATINPENNEIEYHLPTEKFVYDYNGEMINIETQNVSLLTTPNHKIWRRTIKKDNYELIEASNLEKHINIKASFNYKGEELKDYAIPSVKRKKGANKLAQVSELKTKADDLLEYLGYFLSEGGLLKETSPNFRYIHTLSQKNLSNVNKIRNCINRLGFSNTEYKSNDGCIRWNVYGKQLNSWLREQCGDACDNKIIPIQFKQLSKRQIRILFDALMIGDGSWDKRENRTSGYYSTTSNQLADDVQEIALKLGYSVSKNIHYEAKENRKKCYVVHISKRKEHKLRDYKKNINYSGKVWCFEVPNHIFIVRRDGKISAQGNSNAEATDYVFSKRTIKPKMTRLVEQLNEFLLPMFPDGENLLLGFEDPVPEDMENKLKLYDNGLKNKWLTPNEVREMQNLEPLEGGDEVVSGPTPADKKRLKAIGHKINTRNKISARKAFVKDTKEKISKAVDSLKGDIRKMVVKEEIRRDKNVMRWSEDKKIENHELVLKRASRNEMRYRNAVEKQFESQEKRILQGKEKNILQRDWKLDVDNERQIWFRILLPIMTDIVREEGQQVMNSITSGLIFDSHTELIRNFIDNRTMKISREVNGETNRIIVKIIKNNPDANEVEIGRKISKKFKDMKLWRSKLIARTETFKAVNFATDESYLQSGVVEAKEWFTGMDERVCPYCRPMNGKTIGVGKTWFKQGETIQGDDGVGFVADYESIQNPPLHANCRCGLVPVLVGAKKFKSILKAKFMSQKIDKEIADGEHKKNTDKATKESTEDMKRLTDKIDGLDKKVSSVQEKTKEELADIASNVKNALED